MHLEPAVIGRLKFFVEFGCDGTSVNIAAGGLRGHLEEPMPWMLRGAQARS